jgi:hypothetical protein
VNKLHHGSWLLLKCYPPHTDIAMHMIESCLYAHGSMHGGCSCPTGGSAYLQHWHAAGLGCTGCNSRPVRSIFKPTTQSQAAGANLRAGRAEPNQAHSNQASAATNHDFMSNAMHMHCHPTPHKCNTANYQGTHQRYNNRPAMTLQEAPSVICSTNANIMDSPQGHAKQCRLLLVLLPLAWQAVQSV